MSRAKKHKKEKQEKLKQQSIKLGLALTILNIIDKLVDLLLRFLSRE